MRPKCVTWNVTSDSTPFFESRPTRASADRLAQKMANKYKETFYYHTARERKRAYRRNKMMKVFLVAPTEDTYQTE